MRPSKKLFRFPSGFVAASALYSPCRCCCTFVLRSRRLTLSSCKRSYPQETGEKKLLPLASISFTLFPLLPPDVSLSSKALPPPSSLSKAHQRGRGKKTSTSEEDTRYLSLSRPHAQSWHSRRLGGGDRLLGWFSAAWGQTRTDGGREGGRGKMGVPFPSSSSSFLLRPLSWRKSLLLPFLAASRGEREGTDGTA